MLLRAAGAKMSADPAWSDRKRKTRCFAKNAGDCTNTFASGSEKDGGMLFSNSFRGARATGHVFFLNRGRARNKGLAFSGYVGPMTTVAVVPTTPQILDFSVQARTQDKQTIIVTGNVKVALVPHRGFEIRLYRQYQGRVLSQSLGPVAAMRS